MKQNNRRWMKFLGWVLFLAAIGFFCLQLIVLYIGPRYQVEYIDNRLFYLINIISGTCLLLGILFLIRLTRRIQLFALSTMLLFVIVHITLLVESNNEIKNITSVSPNFKQVFSIKQNVTSGESFYYRSYYGILGRPKEILPKEIVGEYKVEWLANDVAAFTYQTNDDKTQQFIGTYGDRKNGRSYYYVGAEIHGEWKGDDITVVSSMDGISIIENNNTELFSWENIHQFGTLAVVLKKNDEAIWTISLNENFVVNSASYKTTVGDISLYKATMDKNKPSVLEYEGSN